MKKITFILFAIMPLLGFAQFTVANPDFSSNTTEWVSGGAATIAWEDTDGNTAAGSLELVATGVNGRAQTDTAVTPLLGNYTVSAWVKGPAGAQFQLAVFQGASGNNEFSSIYTIDIADDNAWTFYEYTASDLNDVGTRIRLIAKSVDTFYFDDIEVTQVVSERNLYTFDTDDVVEAWDERGGTNTGPASGVLTFTPDADSFAKLVQEGYFIDSSVNSHIRIVMQNLSTNDDEFRVIAPGGGNSTISITTSDATEQTYEIDLSGLAGWTGNVTELELSFRDADNAAGAGKSSGTGAFLINSIGFFTPALPYIVTVADGNWNDTATWAGGVLPTVLDDVQVEHVLTLNGDQSAKDVTITTGNSVAINKDSSLSIAGNLVTDAGANNSIVMRCDSDQFSSLIVDGTVTGDIRFRRYVNDLDGAIGNDLISSPVAISSFNDFYSDNDSFFVEDASSDAVLFGPFNNGGNPGVYENWDFDATTALSPGTGYRMGTNGTLVESSALNFHGTPTTGNVNVTLTDEVGSFGKWNLIGNPYTSFISLSDFLGDLATLNNDEFDASSSGVYGYDGDASDGWVIWNQAYSDANAGTLITPGQGFFVASKVGGGSIDFTPSMQRIGLGTEDDFIAGRNAASSHVGHFKIVLNSAASSYFTDFYFNTNASQDLDPGYDSKVFGEGVPSFSVYSHLVQGNIGDAMAVQSLGGSDVSDVIIPLGINASQGEQITISMSDIDLSTSVEVILEDTLENTFTLLNASDYTFTPSTNLSGTGRFFLRVAEDALSLGENSLDTVQIYASNDLLVVNGNIKINTVLKLYDIQGRLVISKTLDSSSVNQTIDVSNATIGVYIVVLEGQGYTETKKVIIN